MRNSLKGEVISAWIAPGDLPHFKVLKFFADDVLHKELLERRNGDKGWNIFLYVGAQFTKAHISQQPGVAAAAVAEANELKSERDRKEAAAEVERATKAIADREATEQMRKDAAKQDEAKEMDTTDNWTTEVPDDMLPSPTSP